MKKKPAGSKELNFHDHAAGVLHDLQEATARVIAALPGKSKRAVDVQRTLKLDATLSWQIVRLAMAPTPVEAGEHVPASTSMRKFLDAVGRHDVPGQLIASTSAAYERFERFVVERAGDRSAFTSMIANNLGERSDAINLRHRKSAYRALTYLRGIRMACSVSTSIVGPRALRGPSQRVRVRGHFGLQRLRPDLPLVIGVNGLVEKPGRQIDREPIDPEGGEHGLLPRFCTKPLPRICETQLQENWFKVEWLPEPFGATAAVSCVRAHVEKRTEALGLKDGTVTSLTSAVAYPMELYVYDLLMAQDDNEPTLTPAVRSYAITGREHAMPLGTFDEVDRVEIGAKVSMVGRGRAALRLHEVPDYADMIEFCLKRMGWDLNRFQLYRCRAPYPLVPCMIETKFMLPANFR